MVYYSWVMKMAAKYEITAEQMREIKQARKMNKNKRIEAKLKVLVMRGEGASAKEISKGTGFHPAYVSTLVSKYIHNGLEAITGNHYGGNHRNMTFEEEATFLEQFIDDADGGQITDVSAIKAAYDEKVGHKTGHGQIYYVLHRHGWTKKMPRSKHPKSADPEAVEASKKLTLESEN